MSPSKQIVVAFDAYGTLLSTSSIADKLASHFGKDKAAAIATEWRRLQLEYTWRLNSMGLYEPFSTLTKRSLQHALAVFDLVLDAPSTDALMTAYDTLSIFPDVAPGLQALAAHPTIAPHIFSNGTHAMIHASLARSPDLGPFATLFKSIVVVEPVRKFKPAPEAYFHLAAQVGMKSEEMREMWLVSSNPFDVVGAGKVGMKTCWVDREGRGWKDALLGVEGEGGPTVVVRGIEGVVDAVLGR